MTKPQIINQTQFIDVPEQKHVVTGNCHPSQEGRLLGPNLQGNRMVPDSTWERPSEAAQSPSALKGLLLP